MNVRKIDSRQDILLLFLYSKGTSEIFNEPIIGKTRLVKMLFLFFMEGLNHFKKGTNVTEDNFYHFFPWNFGPFSQQVYDDLTFFILRRFITTESMSSDNSLISQEEYEHWTEISGATFGYDDNSKSEYQEQKIMLTDKGVEYTKNLYELLSEAQISTLKQFKAKLNSSTLKTILRYVYLNYPDYTSDSQIKDNILGGTYE